MKTLILGASLKPNRYSNLAIQKFNNSKYDAVGIGRSESQLGKVNIFKGTPDFKDIHTISIYLNQRSQSLIPRINVFGRQSRLG